MYLVKLKNGNYRIVESHYRLGACALEYRCVINGHLFSGNDISEIQYIDNCFPDSSNTTNQLRKDLLSACQFLNKLNQNGEVLEHYQTLDLGDSTAYINISIEPNDDEDNE